MHPPNRWENRGPQKQSYGTWLQKAPPRFLLNSHLQFSSPLQQTLL